MRRSLPRTVVLLGIVSLLNDVASDMIVPLFPAFLTATLGGGAIALGAIEGTADALASLLKLFSGVWADRLRRYRVFVVTGYVVSSLARPLVAIAHAPWHVVVVRALDRTGKGLRTSPRDALIATAVPASRQAEAFGFHRAMDHAGAAIGPLVAVLLLAFVTTDLRTIFALALVPGVISFVFLARVRIDDESAVRAGKGLPWKSAWPNARLVRFLVPVALFTLGNASDVFLLLAATAQDAPLYSLPLLWMALHFVKATSSLWGGRFADRVGAVRSIALGWLVYAAVYAGLAFAESQLAIVVLTIVYGVHHGLTESAEKAVVSALAPAHLRGAYFGWYHLTIGVLALPASAVFGFLWELASPRAAFLFGASLAFVACVALIVLVPRGAATAQA